MIADNDLIRILFMTGAFSLVQLPKINMNNQDISKLLGDLNTRKKPEVESLTLIQKKTPYSYLKYNLGEITQNTPLLGKLIGVLPETTINLIGSDIDFESLKLTSAYKNMLTFDKFLALYNPTKIHDWVKIKSDENDNPIIHTNYTRIRNGPFEIYIENDALAVRSWHGNLEVIPGKVILQKNNKHIDSLEVVKEPFYPAHYISSKLKEKKEIDALDLLGIIGSYHNLKGDYFDINHKNLVCTDVATLPIKTMGLDYQKMIEYAKIPGKEYKQRNITIFRTLLEKLNYSKYIHYFMDKDLSKLEKFGTYENITANNFGIKELTPGQIIMLTRIYNTGPQKGKMQRENVHFAVTSEINNGLITKAAMVSSTSTTPPYTQNIMLQTDVNFKQWFEYRQDYRGSDESPESFKYRVTGLIDLVAVINAMKKDFGEKEIKK